MRRLLGVKKTVYVQERVPFYRDMWQSAAKAEGFEFLLLSDSTWEVRDGEKSIAKLSNYVVSLDDPVTLGMAGDKPLTYAMFSKAGLSVPAYTVVTLDSLAKLRTFIDSNVGPYVIKPARDTSSGLGVTTNLHTFRQCLKAVALALAYCDQVLIEKHVVGESYRLLFLGHEMIGAARRSGIRVIGDGEKSVGQLIAAELPKQMRSWGQKDWQRDSDIRLTLASQGLDLDFVPASGRVVLVRSSGKNPEGQMEVRTVYTDDVTDVLCDELVEEARTASLLVGSEFCGVDVITMDPSMPLAACDGTITEINTTPGLHHHYGLDSSRQTEPLANKVIRYMASKAVNQ